jgi:hypothetical protein
MEVTMSQLKPLPDLLCGIGWAEGFLPQPSPREARFAQLAIENAAQIAPDANTRNILQQLARILSQHPEASETLTNHLLAVIEATEQASIIRSGLSAGMASARRA